MVSVTPKATMNEHLCVGSCRLVGWSKSSSLPAPLYSSQRAGKVTPDGRAGRAASVGQKLLMQLKAAGSRKIASHLSTLLEPCCQPSLFFTHVCKVFFNWSSRKMMYKKVNLGFCQVSLVLPNLSLGYVGNLEESLENHFVHCTSSRIPITSITPNPIETGRVNLS